MSGHSRQVHLNHHAYRVQYHTRDVVMRYAPPAFDMQFTGPFGINGQASINLPTWMSHPNPQFTVQKVPAHPSDLNHGLQCTPIEVALLPGITVHRFAHLQM